MSGDLPALCALLRTTKGRQLYLPTPGADVAWRSGGCAPDRGVRSLRHGTGKGTP
jgi:hypothetical protein